MPATIADADFAPLAVADFVALEESAASFTRPSKAKLAREAGASPGLIDDMVREDVAFESGGSAYGSPKFFAYLDSEAGTAHVLSLSLGRGMPRMEGGAIAAHVKSMRRGDAVRIFNDVYARSLRTTEAAPENPPQPPSA